MGAARRLVDPAHALPEFARRVFAFVEEARRQQDNEQWHLLILEELLRERGERQGLLRFVVAPQFLALAFYHVSWILYVLRCAPLRNARRSKISATRPLGSRTRAPRAPRPLRA